MSKPANEFNLEDLFGSVPTSFTKDTTTKYPNTVPFVKGSFRGSILGDIFDNNTDFNKHSSATVALRRKSKNSSSFFSSNTNNNNNSNNSSVIENTNSGSNTKYVKTIYEISLFFNFTRIQALVTA